MKLFWIVSAGVAYVVRAPDVAAAIDVVCGKMPTGWTSYEHALHEQATKSAVEITPAGEPGVVHEYW